MCSAHPGQQGGERERTLGFWVGGGEEKLSLVRLYLQFGKVSF
jgi:hypothetical protein